MRFSPDLLYVHNYKKKCVSKNSKTLSFTLGYLCKPEIFIALGSNYGVKTLIKDFGLHIYQINWIFVSKIGLLSCMMDHCGICFYFL